MTKKKPSPKKKPKPTIESLQKEIRSLKRTITSQRELTDYLRRLCQDIFRMYDEAQSASVKSQP
jgi:hypothetical protein